MAETKEQPAAAPRCWACHGEIGPSDNFCRHCGSRVRSATSPTSVVHERLTVIEKRLVHVLIGMGLLLIVLGWIALQLYHFGRGGILG